MNGEKIDMLCGRSGQRSFTENLEQGEFFGGALPTDSGGKERSLAVKNTAWDLKGLCGV